MTTTISYADVPSMVGRQLGHSRWIHIDQKRIDTFADATDDHQWIHVDPDRAKDGPFGTTIAHGYLTLALVIPLWSELLEVEGVTTKVNYGLNSVRFPAPVPSGAQIRLSATVAEVTEIRGGFQLMVDAVVECEGVGKPVCVAQLVLRFYA